MNTRSMLTPIGCLLSLAVLLVACAPQPTVAPTPTPLPSPSPTPEEVVLTLGAWRTATERLNYVLGQFHRQNPHITVRFEPSLPDEYDEILAAQLETGSSPDLFFLRSFSASRELYESGYLSPLDDLLGLPENFDAAMLAPWTGADGIPYGVPFTATSHGIYYNQEIFQALGLDMPTTWEDLLETAQVLQENGYIPFANGSRDAWTSAEIIFMVLAPNYIGGREGRMAYLRGERCFNDAQMVAAFQAVADLAPYLPQNHALLGYIDSLELFLQGKAAMWMSGSWDIPYLEDAEPEFDWSVFAVPAPAGQPTYVTFHLDVAIGLAAASQHQEEARAFLTWLTTPSFGALLADEMPGFFPMHRDVPPLANPHAAAFLALNDAHETDVRFAWEMLWDGAPSGYTLMQDGALSILAGEQTPREAADALQEGLAQWFAPAQSCK